jgi:TRAP-type C4-dicarboxylate transport system substrate-binding protein
MRSLLLSLLGFCSIAAHATELNFWSPQPQQHPTTQALQSLADRITRNSGRFESRLLPSAGKGQSALLAELKSGDIGVAVLTGSTVAKLAPTSNVLQLPFVFRDSKQMFAVLDGDVGKDIEQSMEAQGLILLGWFNGGARSFYTRDKPGSLSDLQSAKVRIPNRADLKTLVNSLGGTPVVLPYDGVPAAFESGEIDVAENDLLAYEADQHYKRAKFFVQTNHFVQFEALVVSSTVWAQLSEAERKSFRDAGRAAAQLDRETWTRRLASARTRLEKEGVKFIEVRDNTVMASRVSAVFKPYFDNPATSTLLLRLLTMRS